MSVYIKGMEMPTCCEKCPFLDYEEGFCFASAVKGKSGWYESKLRPRLINGGRHDECPLVSVTPHGRLIDADKFTALVFADPYQDFVHIIEQMPIIIEAEEGE